jgi:hypothetical protein
VGQWGHDTNLGMTISRPVWRSLLDNALEFCSFDDYNWDLSLERLRASNVLPVIIIYYYCKQCILCQRVCKIIAVFVVDAMVEVVALWNLRRHSRISSKERCCRSSKLLLLYLDQLLFLYCIVVCICVCRRVKTRKQISSKKSKTRSSRRCDCATQRRPSIL